MRAEAVGGPIFTRAYKVLLAIGILGILITIWRFWVGLGASTALSDGYPLGIWIAFDVVTGTALACGGYAVALLVYIFNRGKYHPLVRPAILTSALGYSIAGVSVAIDLGRPWNMWKIPLYFRSWNLNSALLEVALCIMAYVGVLWVELSPALLEKWSWPPAKRISAIVDRLLIWIIALGMLLPTMHQSSLGSLMLLAGPKLQPLWNSPFLPLFFLITCVAMGYSIVVFESTFSSMAFKRKVETPLLANLQRIAAIIGVVFVAGRLLDLLVRGQFGFALRLDVYGIFFWIENILFILPMLMTKRDANLGMLFRSAMVLAVAGALFRFDTYLLAFDSGPGWHYFPSVAELLITIGLVAFELAIYIALVKRFPILSGAAPAPVH
jgi:Ni/Fe-hydrogenase subunit HybB-like protein